jgi:hypothetical protein
MSTISKYKKIVYGNHKMFEELMELKGIQISDLKRFESEATTEITAYYVHTDVHFLYNIFIYDNSVYGFACPTYYDFDCAYYEVLEGIKQGRIIREWYEGLVENERFQIRINPDNPAQFYISDEKFYPMNKGVTFIGKWDMQFQKNIITYDARKLGIPRYRFDYLRGRIGFWDFISEFPRITKALIRRIRNTIRYERQYVRE